MQDVTTNGLGDLVAIGNLTAVGALIVIVVVGFLWLIFRGLPRACKLVLHLIVSHRRAEANSRREFIAALDRQNASRAEAAKSGHEAAQKIADSVQQLTKEIRQVNEERRTVLKNATCLAAMT